MATKLAETVTRRPIRFERASGANHFLNDGPAEQLVAALEACIPATSAWTFRWPKPAAFWPAKLPRPQAVEAQAQAA